MSIYMNSIINIFKFTLIIEFELVFVYLASEC
jgi:hypothetical protein